MVVALLIFLKYTYHIFILKIPTSREIPSVMCYIIIINNIYRNYDFTYTSSASIPVILWCHSSLYLTNSGTPRSWVKVCTSGNRTVAIR